MGFNFNRPKFGSTSAPLLARDVLRATASLNFGSISTDANQTLTITVPGAAVGDAVVLSFIDAGGPLAALEYHVWVSAADTVSVRARNYTAAPIDQAAQNLHVIVFKAY